MTILLRIFAGLMVFSFSGCSPVYVARAAYEQSKILLARQDIEDALQDSSMSEEMKEKLHYVLEAREFAVRAGLEPEDSFTKFAMLDRDVLSWIVMGCKKDSFEPYKWWFPIVGSIPYKGFFEKENAQAQARSLEEDGYETWVRDTDAMSTLGWFNDPVLSTTLRHPIPSIVNTVIHEIVHTTFWFKGSVDFNESFANFIGTTGAVLFFEEKLAACNEDAACLTKIKPLLDEARGNRARTMEIAGIIGDLYRALDELYKTDKTSEQKVAEREAVFAKAMNPIRARYPKMRSFHSVNNAEIMQVRIYMTKLELFERLLARSGSIAALMDAVRDIEGQYKKSDEKDPFALLAKVVAG